MKFMNDDFLLNTKTAKLLYHTYAKELPILDYHCHINPMEIALDRKFDNITQVWLGGDHYKWRQMRFHGVEEKYITGDASDREKFQAFAETLPKAIGNPLYHWSHLELSRYFGYDGVLNGSTAEEVWEICNKKIAAPEMSARNLMRQSNVKVICTTDDPVDDLRWHKMIRDDETFDIQVLPSWRPDKALAVGQTDFNEYIVKLSEVSGIDVNSYASWKEAMVRRLDFFVSMGCKVTDHGMLFVPYRPISDEKADRILKKAIRKQPVTEEEAWQFMTVGLLFLGQQYASRGLTMQLHFGVTRNNNGKMFERIGADTGFDGIYNRVPINELSDFLNALDEQDALPKTILYSLNPNDNAAIGALIGCFESSDAVGKIQHGAAWWFNDHKSGMKEQMKSLACFGLLGHFIGMLTDSRSFLSYTRHEYFRRILCQMIGTWVEDGEYPMDEEELKKIIQGISYYNAKDYFQFEL